MTDRFEPTQKEDHDEIFELTHRETYFAGDPETPEMVDRFTSETSAREWAAGKSIHVISFVKVTRLQW